MRPTDLVSAGAGGSSTLLTALGLGRAAWWASAGRRPEEAPAR